MFESFQRAREISPHASLTAGKYLISPLTKILENGWYACSVSIRSGSGSATTDRVVRFTRLFENAPDAARYATREGLHWIGAGANGLRPS